MFIFEVSDRKTRRMWLFETSDEIETNNLKEEFLNIRMINVDQTFLSYKEFTDNNTSCDIEKTELIFESGFSVPISKASLSSFSTIEKKMK